MKERIITKKQLSMFEAELRKEEKSAATVEKYLRDARAFISFAEGAAITKELTISYKQELISDGYAVRSINSMLASVNSLFAFFGWHDCKVKAIKLQHEIFRPEEKELTKAEYERLCRTAEKKHNERLCLLLQTICGTGIRVSELQFITVEAVKRGGSARFLQSENTRGVHCPGTAKKIAPLLRGAKYSDRVRFYHEIGQADEPDDGLAGDEKSLRRGECHLIQSLSA